MALILLALVLVPLRGRGRPVLVLVPWHVSGGLPPDCYTTPSPSQSSGTRGRTANRQQLKSRAWPRSRRRRPCSFAYPDLPRAGPPLDTYA